MQATVEAPPQPTPTPAPAGQGTAAPTVVSSDLTTPAAVYDGYVEKARVLRDQLEGLINERSQEIAALQTMSGSDMAQAREVVTQRISRLDKRIAGIEEQIAQTDAQVATAAAVPGAIVRYRDTGPSDEDLAGVFFGGATTMLMVSLLFVAFRRWRRRKHPKPAKSGMPALPAEVASRMERLEAIAEATALEVERIGEGQRFVTKLLSEQQKVPLQK